MRAQRASKPLAAFAALFLFTACSGDHDPAAQPTATPTEALWNPCDALDLDDVAAWFGGEFTEEVGTATAPLCAFTPEVEGGPAVDANYLLVAGGLDAVFESMTDLDPDDVADVAVPGADAAKVVVDFDDSQLFVSGFVQNDDLIQTVDVVDPTPYDKVQVVRAVRSILADFSAAAPPPTS